MQSNPTSTPSGGDSALPQVWEAPLPSSMPTSAPLAPCESAAHVALQGREVHDVPCLGSASAGYAPQLQEMIDDELTDHRRYQILARRVPAGAGPVLASMSADELRHARKLSAALFLITGVRYWPSVKNAPVTGAWPAALRAAFAGEQQGAAQYLSAAGETADPALKALWEELAGDEAGHAQRLREILERF